MGTVGYMSPEQVRGHETDHRSDIFSFGLILYEMLTGRRAFLRETIAETMTAILKEEPEEVTAINRKVPPQLERIVSRCLEKKPALHFQSTSDLGFAIEALSTSSDARMETAAALPAVTDSGLRARVFDNSRFAWIVAAVSLLGLLSALPFAIGNLNQSKPQSTPIVRFDIPTPARTVVNLMRMPGLNLSADGSTLAFVALSDGVSRIYVRRRDESEARPLTGTEGALDAVFSPDGKRLAFFADLTLKTVSLDGPVVSLAQVRDTRGVRWANNDTIIYTPEAVGPLFQIPAGGGTPRQVSEINGQKNERTHRWPQALPGGKAVLFTVGVQSSPDDYERATIEAVILGTGERRVLLENASMARYVPTGHLIFARLGVLYAVSFDVESLTARGAAVSILQDVAGDRTTGAAHFSIADDGTLAYIPGGQHTAGPRRLVWADQNGQMQTVDLPPAVYNEPRFSPDGSRVAVIVGPSGRGDLWVYDIRRTTFTRLTFNATNASPVWSADGKSIFYVSVDPTLQGATLLHKPADGSREAEAVVSLDEAVYLKDVGPDGTWALLDYKMHTNRADIAQLPLQQGAQMTPIVATPFHEHGASLSPDGRWLAYESSESGRPEIYVRDLSGSGGRWQVSTAGGEEARWSADGRRLYYRNNELFMSVAVETRPSFQTETPKEIFKGVFNLRASSGASYDRDPKGNRFLMIRPSEEDSSALPIRVVLNWFEELRSLAPMN